MQWLSSLLNVPEFGLMAPRSGNIVLPILGFVICIAAAYLLGSLNFAIIISKYKFHDDIRSHGSSNAGMTNMLRTYGKTAAVMTLVGDALKAVTALIIGLLLLGEIGTYAAGLAVIVGHVYPVWFGFKGGKGVVTAIVTVLFLNPFVGLCVILIFVVVVAVSRYISLGSIIGAAFYPMLVYAFSPEPDFKVVFAFIIAVFIIWMHRSNIMRLKDGKENKIGFGKKK